MLQESLVMYPADYLALYPAFPRDDTVFVAMSFDPRLDARWQNVIAPAIRNVQRSGKRLEPLRVDARKISGSVLTEILSGISRARAVFADITALDELNKRHIRNANVMYEVGLAHACRLAEEVLLFRSDDGELLFDVANVRVNRYAPDKRPEEARTQLTETIVAVLKELDLRRHLAVRQAVDSLDVVGWVQLSHIAKGKGNHPRNLHQAAALARLLELGAVRATYALMTPETLAKLGDEAAPQRVVRYEPTEFGQAVLREVTARSHVELSPKENKPADERSA